MAVGPVDVYIIGFPGNKFTGRIAPAIMDLVENGTIRVLDLLFVMKDADGVVTTLAGCGHRRGGRGLPLDRHRAAGCVGARGRRGGQRRPPVQQLGAPGRIREPLGREAGRRPPGRGRRRDRLDPDPGRRRVGRARRKLDPVHFEIERNDMGLLRMAARTAVVAGTATAVSGRVQRRQAAKYDQQDAQQYAQEPQYAQERAAAGRGRLDRAAPEPGGSCTRRACSPTRSSRPPRPRSSESDRNARGPVRQVEAYSRLAGVYDEIVIDPCHDRWASFLHELWSADPEGVRSVLDLCCGTGLLAGELIARGYRVVGVDASEAMLALARERLGPEVALSRMTLPDLDGRRCLRRGGLHVRRPQLPHSGRAATDDGRGRPPPSARRLARLRPAHRRDDGLHDRQPHRRGYSRPGTTS